MRSDFDDLTPELFLPVLETALECDLKGFASAFHSYINRVYEVRTAGDGVCLVVKFYRPGRWSADAILDEHDYLWECADSDVPVVPPYVLADGSTLGWLGEIPFSVFPKKRGRDVSFELPDELKQAGALVARLHAVGSRRTAEYRMVLDPFSLIDSVTGRLSSGVFPHEFLFRRFTEICNEIAEISAGAFPAGDSFLRLHGDLHRANILSRPEEGLILIDFDDMLTGPPVQDLWMLLPDSPSQCPEETRAILDGYSLFRDFDESSFAVVECLRAMRMLYFLSWCAMQRNDLRFSETFPDWGTEPFWRAEFADLTRQIPKMKEEIRFWSRPRWL